MGCTEVSTAKRVATGTIAAWVRLIATIAAQLVFVPISLKSWDQETLGLWMAMQAILAIMQVPDIAIQSYLDGEFLKLGPEKKHDICQTFADGCSGALALATVELVAVAVLAGVGALGFLAGLAHADANGRLACNVFAVGNSIIWLVFGAIEGIAVRLLVPFGYFARVTWWGTVASLTLAVVPIAVVWFGGTIWIVVIAYLVARTMVASLLAFDLIRIFRRESLQVSTPRWNAGMHHWARSSILLVEGYAEQLRQQGVRLLLGPVAGASGVSKFATIRTGANLALQGMGVITGPVVPEMMRFVRNRDTNKLQAGIAFLWTALLVVLVPGILFVQWFAPWGFHLWTRGKVDFDASMFAWFSVGVLLFGLGQPAIAIVRSNNLLRYQLLISASIAIITIVSVFAMLEWNGLRGAAIALAATELVATAGYVIVVQGWLRQRSLDWPWRSFCWASLGVLFASIATVSMTDRSSYSSVLVSIGFIGWFVSVGGLIVSFPTSMHDYINDMWTRVQFWRTNVS